MLPGILQLWPLAKWILQALGLMGPEDKEAERTYQLKLMEAVARKDEGLIKAWAEFQALWRPSAERVYVFANTAIALFQPTILALVYYDVIWGQRRSIQAAVDLQGAGIPGLLIMAIMLFPFYGPALVSAVGGAFQSAVDLVGKKANGRLAPPASPPASRVSVEPDEAPRVVPHPYTAGSGFRGRPVDPPPADFPGGLDH